MTLIEASKILGASALCMRRRTSEQNDNCQYMNCDSCELWHEQGTTYEHIEALELVAKALKDSQEQMDIASESVKVALLAHCFNCGMKEGIRESEASSPTQMSGTSDLVSRQYLLDEYDRQHVGPPGGARKIIEEAPAVTEQKKGRWIPVDDPSITGRCSVCGFESHLCEDDVYGYDYCPDCGARLEVVDE